MPRQTTFRYTTPKDALATTPSTVYRKPMPIEIVWNSFVAGILASLACGLGALPLALKSLDVQKRAGLGYALAAGLMLTASIVNLIMPGLTMGNGPDLQLGQTVEVVGGILLGAAFIWVVHQYLSPERLEQHHWKRWGNRSQILIFIAMAVHSIPEGVAVGVGYAGGEHYALPSLGGYIALAIAIHNIPEGLAVAIPMRATGASIQRCFWAAVLTSVPQPIAAVPACIFAWIFKPLMPALMGFAGGAMIYLVIMELIPDALEKESPVAVAWAATVGFCLMLLVQVIL